MAERVRIDFYYLDVWNGKDFTRSESMDVDKVWEAYERHKRVMPNCPVNIVGEALIAGYDPKESN